jgi:TrmH family RNA methyltransferase
VTWTAAQRRHLDRIARGRDDEGLALLEGPKAVADALRLGVVRDLLVRRDLDPAVRDELVHAAREARVAVTEGSADDFDRLRGTVTPQGVLAVVRDTAEPLPTTVARRGALLWLDGVQDPGNVGAVVRVAAAFGVAGLLVGAGTADPLGLKALRASAGLALRMPFARATGDAIAGALRAARRPVWLLDAGGEDLFRAGAAPADVALVVGSEGRGAGPEARAVATRTLAIPLAPGVDSLNAAVATGIAVAVLARRP